MLSNIARIVLALSVAARCLSQDAASEIPTSEQAALAAIVEDDPDAPIASARKGGNESPKYTLYSKALPIPPEAQVK